MIRILANSRCLDDKVNVSEKKKRKNCCACLGARERINLKSQICWIAFRELHEYWKYFPKKETSSFWKMQKKICLSPKDASYRICHYDYNTQNIIFFHIFINLVLFTIIQWNLPLEQVFKDAVADSVTTFCGESRDCEITAPRKRLLHHYQA